LKDYDVKVPIENTREKISESENRLKVIARKKKKIDQVYETSDTMDYAIYQKKIDECKREEEKLKNEIAIFNQQLLRKDEVRASADHFRKLYDELRVQIQNATYEEKSDIIHLLVDKITFYKEEEMAEVRMKVPIDISDSLTTQDVLGDQNGRGNNVLCPHRINGVDAIYPFIFRVKLSDLKERRREILLKTKQYLYKARRDSLLEPSRTP
jgi:HAMP domain-containing protein